MLTGDIDLADPLISEHVIVNSASLTTYEFVLSLFNIIAGKDYTYVNLISYFSDLSFKNVSNQFALSLNNRK